MSEVLRLIGYGLCHQLPERSFFGGGVQVPVCARDTGIYLGFIVSMLVIAALSRGARPTGYPPIWMMVLAGLAFGTMVLDGVTSYAGLRATTNDIRLATGIAAGFPMGMVLAPIFNSQVWARPSAARILGDRESQVAWIASAFVLFAVVKWVLPLLGPAYPILVAVAVVAVFAAVNLTMVCLVPKFENAYVRLRQAWLPLCMALALTFGELWLTGALRGFVTRLAGLP